jgi:hypothetical protein
MGCVQFSLSPSFRQSGYGSKPTTSLRADVGVKRDERKRHALSAVSIDLKLGALGGMLHITSWNCICASRRRVE